MYSSRLEKNIQHVLDALREAYYRALNVRDDGETPEEVKEQLNHTMQMLGGLYDNLRRI